MKTLSNKTLLAVSRYHVTEQQRDLQNDSIIVEEPLQIRLLWKHNSKLKDEIYTITMRTPGSDQFLTTGLLLAEGIIRSNDDILGYHTETENGEVLPNQLTIELSESATLDVEKFNRRLASNSSCGLCGKTSLKSIEVNNPPQIPEINESIEPAVIYSLPEKLRQQQTLFHQCGGVHAAGLFSQSGDIINCAEDVGRHNALDKLFGEQLINNYSISGTEIVLLSGRASFELVQKTVMSGYAVLASVGAPSSLAIAAAQRFNLTLIGFVNGQSINVYTGMWRLMPNSTTMD